MALKVNLRNNTSLYIKVEGLDDIIVPNTPLDDRTFSWESDSNKVISFFTNEECTNLSFTGSLSLVNNDGIYVDRGNQTTDSIKLDADISSSFLRIVQESNGTGGKLMEFSEITPDTTVNLSYFNL
jgi:hypothetical protein